jgi:hypothetical protein
MPFNVSYSRLLQHLSRTHSKAQFSLCVLQVEALSQVDILPTTHDVADHLCSGITCARPTAALVRFAEKLQLPVKSHQAFLAVLI